MSPLSNKLSLIDSIQLFQSLTNDQKLELAEGLETRKVKRGELLVTQGVEAIALYLVVAGRFQVLVDGTVGPVAEIGPGQPVGEVAFLAGGKRTASVKALRDSITLRLTRNQFDRFCKDNPDIWARLTVWLANRLAGSNSKTSRVPDPVPRTIVVIPAGQEPLPSQFTQKLVEQLGVGRAVEHVHAQSLEKVTNGATKFNKSDIVRSLNNLEFEHDIIVFTTGDRLNQRSKIAIRQADLVLKVARHKTEHLRNCKPNSLEDFADSVVESSARRLVLLHETSGPIKNTAKWLKDREVFMHHHICESEEAGYARLARFITGRAIGFVACGGGAFCAAHIGVYQALLSAGVVFDMFGGTSGGAAMTAAFATGTSPDEIDEKTGRMFVKGKAMSRYNLPMFSLLDHENFDQQLRECYSPFNIEDLWVPFFAIATDLTNRSIHCMREGRLWKAVRASGSVPALLPPFPTDDGRMLVDGALMDNVPIAHMHELKSGPNIVVNFEDCGLTIGDVEYSEIPSRWELAGSLLSGASRGKLKGFPSTATVLMRSLNPNRGNFEQHICEKDILFIPPVAADVGVLDWHRHTELKDAAFTWTNQRLQALSNSEKQVLCEMTI